jgi:hypothetical protein
MNSFNNFYEVTKTVRFELNPQIINREYELLNQLNHIDLTKKFIEKYDQIIKEFEKLIFFKDDNGEKYLNSKVYIKYTWLKVYTKQEFYKVKDQIITYNNKEQKKSNQVSISDEKISFLFERFELWFEKNKELLEDLKEFIKKPEESQKLISDLAYYIHQILTRSNFEFIQELFNGNIQDKTSQSFQKTGNFILECKKDLKNLENILLPMQSMGLVIEKASLNYYTVNKKSKDYPIEIQSLKNKLDEKFVNFSFPDGFKNNLENLVESLDLNIEANKKLVEEFGNLNEIENWSIQKIYKNFKFYKAKQKSNFLEFIADKKDYSELKNEKGLFLMNDFSKANFDKFVSLSNEITELATQRSDLDNSLVNYKSQKNKLTKKIKEKAQNRGKHFMFNFSKYKKFSNLYKNVAIELGESKAKIKSLEKEAIDAERVNSWALILKKDNQHYICTIPRDGEENLLNAKQYVNSLTEENSNNWKLYSFESLTLRALEKLCFGLNKNTFIPEIKQELFESQESETFVTKNDRGFLQLKMKHKFSKDHLEIMRFYQKVLGLNATKKMLAIDNFIDFKSFLSIKYSSLENFEKDMKRSCYFKKAISISEVTKNNLVNTFQGNLYKITSYDLEKNDKEVLEKLENKKQLERKNPEKQTQTWLDFWTTENKGNQYHVRLNPELKISFIAKQEEKILDKYGNKRNLGKLGKNRKNKERYLLSTTITEKAHDKKINLAFKTKDEVKTFIDEYNKKFNESIQDPFDIYYYGLDRGQKELLTLGVFKFSKNEKISFIKKDGTRGEYNKPFPKELEIWKLKPEKYLEKKNGKTESYKNISEVIDDEDFIKKEENQYCIDLSCAKLIKDKLVINGDIATYLELKRLSALRKIWEGFSKAKFKSNHICFDAEKRALFLNIENRGKLANEDLYFFDERFGSILTLNSIRNELQNYFDELKKENAEIDIISIEKINNLRDALCANSVGILNHLQEKYFGMMFFENLNENNKNKRISEFSGNLASRIEWKLLQKFKSKNLVPPTYKQVMSLQSKKEIDQLGILGYIETSGTSSDCPHCKNKITDKSEKWGSHNYKCINKNCNFDTSDIKKRQGLDFCDNSDSVASYNIAKRGLVTI